MSIESTLTPAEIARSVGSFQGLIEAVQGAASLEELYSLGGPTLTYRVLEDRKAGAFLPPEFFEAFEGAYAQRQEELGIVPKPPTPEEKMAGFICGDCCENDCAHVADFNAGKGDIRDL